jgi:hypothetical protein
MYIYGIKWMRHYGVPDSSNLLLPDGFSKIRQEDGTILIYWDSVKWYSWSFIDIRILYAFLRTVSEIEDKFGLLKIGEDSEDISYDGNPNVVSDCGVFPCSYVDLGSIGCSKPLTIEDIFFNSQPDLMELIKEI